MKKLVLIFCLLFLATPCFGAVVDGTNAGFVTVAPVDNPSGSTSTADNRATALKITSPADIVAVTEMGFWCDTASEAADYQLGIYTHDAVNDTPEDLIAGSSGDLAKGTSAGWKVATGLSISVPQSTTVWLAFQLDDTETTTNVDITADAGAKKDRKNTQTELPSNWGTSDDTSGNLVAIYAVYTTSSGATRRIIVIE